MVHGLGRVTFGGAGERGRAPDQAPSPVAPLQLTLAGVGFVAGVHVAGFAVSRGLAGEALGRWAALNPNAGAGVLDHLSTSYVVTC